MPRFFRCYVRFLAILLVCVGTTGIMARAADPPLPLSSVLGLTDVVVTPDTARDDEPFTVSAYVVNHGNEEIGDLLWFPSILADPTQPKDHPQMEILGRSPAQLSLAPGADAHITLTFRVTVPGTRHYGLMAALPDRSRGVVFAADARPRQTLPQSNAYVLRRVGAYSLLGVLAGAAFAFALVRSRRFRQAVVAQLIPRLTAREIITFVLVAIALFTVLNLATLLDRASAAGALPDPLYSGSLYVLIPLRWFVPPLLALILARTRVPALFAAVLFIGAYTQVNAALAQQLPLDTFLQLWSPGLALLLLLITLRLVLRAPRRTQLTYALTLAPALWYGAIALPWLFLYVQQVLLRAS